MVTPPPALVESLAWALPWIVAPLGVLWRARRNASLDDESDLASVASAPDAPLVSVVIPARDERTNVERCLRSVLSSDWPRLEVVLVDDGSTDGTGEIARRIAAGDGRLRVLENAPLPEGWFGKQWACHNGAKAARGDILLFGDADTWHAPDLVSRAVAHMLRRGDDLLSIAGRQEMETIWERLVQPPIFALLLARYGGTEMVRRARKAHDVIANGQCFLVRRPVYDAIGGHAEVRGNVAEDLMIGQRTFAMGFRVGVVLGERQLATRMYDSYGALVRGWGKNVYAGGRHAMWGGRIGRFLAPVVIPLPPVFVLLPLVLLVLALLGLLPAPALPAMVAIVVLNVVGWVGVYTRLGLPPWLGLLWPVGWAIILRIIVGAIVRGSRVEWKGRAYVAE